MRVTDLGRLPAARGLDRERVALRRLARAAAAGADTSGHERLLIWEAAAPAVVLPRSGCPARDAYPDVCAARAVPVLRRASGGGTVMVGPGCLNVALVLALDRRPWLRDVAASYSWLLAKMAGALGVPGVTVRSTDLALGERKIAGHAQRRVRGALLHHGVVLYDLDLELIAALLPEPRRRPAYRGARTHREFLINLPLGRTALVARLARLPAALDARAAVA